MQRILWAHRFTMAGYFLIVAAVCLLSVGCGGGDRFLPVYVDQDLQGFGGNTSSSPPQPVLTHTPSTPRGRP